jgi:hypothetical protein
MLEPCDGKLSCTFPRGDVFGDVCKDVSKSYPSLNKKYSAIDLL